MGRAAQARLNHVAGRWSAPSGQACRRAGRRRDPRHAGEPSPQPRSPPCQIPLEPRQFVAQHAAPFDERRRTLGGLECCPRVALDVFEMLRELHPSDGGEGPSRDRDLAPGGRRLGVSASGPQEPGALRCEVLPLPRIGRDGDRGLAPGQRLGEPMLARVGAGERGHVSWVGCGPGAGIGQPAREVREQQSQGE